MPQTVRVLAALALALTVSACADSGPEPTPPLYRNLAEVAGDLDEQTALSMINNYRANNGLGEVVLDDRLTALARDYARELADNAAKGAAIRPDGNLAARLAAVGYGPSEVKESVSAGYYTLAEAFSGWRDSPPHRDTMLLASARDLGIAAAYLPGTKYKVYWVLVLAKPA